MAVVISAGFLFSALLLALRRPVAEVLVGELASDVSRALLPLAIVAPVAFAGFVGTIALAASDADRHFVLLASAVGACVNLSLATVLVPAGGAAAAGLACAVGLALTNVIILLRLVMLGRRLRDVLPAAVEQPAPAPNVY
jgi:O-antigen/teichoic acid export membrane protein